MKAARVVLFIVIGLILGSGAVYVKLRMERSAFEQEIAELNGRFDLLKKKYSEEKARANGLLRTKSTLEGNTRALRAEMEALVTQKEEAVKASEALRAELKEKSESCKAEVQALSERYDSMSKKYEELVAQHEKATTDYEERLSKLQGEKDELDMALKETEYNLERCEKHNTEFAQIAGELIIKYRDKGVADSLAQKEPFTGLKQVKMEKLIQQYQDKIDDHVLEE